MFVAWSSYAISDHFKSTKPKLIFNSVRILLMVSLIFNQILFSSNMEKAMALHDSQAPDYHGTQNQFDRTQFHNVFFSI